MSTSLYYRVEEEKIKGQVLPNGQDAWETLLFIPGVRTTPWGGVLLPEGYVLSMEHDVFGRWLLEQNVILPEAKREEEWM